MTQKREAEFGELLRHWIKKYPQETCSIELKQTKSDSLPLRDIKQAQLDYGHAITGTKGVLMRTQATATGMPDYIYMRQEPAYFAIRYPSCFVLVSVQSIQEEKNLGQKSLTSARAKQICTVFVQYGKKEV